MVTTVNADVERPGRDLGNAWIWMLALSASAFAWAVIGGNETAVNPTLFAVYGTVVAASFVGAVRVYRPLLVGTWVAWCIEICLFALADFAGYAWPSPTPVIWLPAFCFWGIGLVLAAVESRPRPDRRAIVDAALLSLAVLATEWSVIAEAPGVSLGSADFAQVTYLVVFPVLESVFLALTLSLLFMTGTIRSTASVLLLCSVGLTYLSDTLPAFYARHGELGQATHWTAQLSILSLGVAGAMALHPTMRDLFLPRSQRSDVGAVRFVLVAAAPLVPLVLLVWDIAADGSAHSPVVPLLTAACFALSGVRLVDLLTLLRRAARRERAAAAALREQNARLVQLNEIKQSFVSMVSHELRTPLTSIVGYLEHLRRGAGGELTDKQARFVSVMERNAGRLQQLVDDILQLGRADEGRIKLTVESVDVARLVRRAAESAGPAAERKGLTLTVEVASELPDLAGDRRLLAQALDNLVSNAIKFTPADGTVTIRARPAGEGVDLEVRDSGVGIPADELPRLFERFFRASTAAVASGSGLGLAITRSIAELHGGTISVDSTVGVGSTFRLRLPLAPPATPQSRETETLEA